MTAVIESMANETRNGNADARAHVLVVDDLPVDRRVAGRLIEKLGLNVAYAGNGVEALTAIHQRPPGAVVTDLQMPEMNGLELVEEIRATYPHIPVILMTGAGSEDIAIRALRSGAASYVPKRNLAEDLAATLERVLAAAKLDLARQRMLAGLRERDSTFSLDNDPTLVPALVALLLEDLAAMNVCDDTGRIRIGIALEEALLNSLYHGNLEVGSELRQNGDDAFHALAARRRHESPYRDRRIRVFASVAPEEARYVIRDQGPGFDVATLPDPTDPANLEKASGRGILLIRTFMDCVNYNAAGNQLTMIKRRERPTLTLHYSMRR